MPALVGLGASLGNKSEITPMLRYRDGNCWIWPQDCRTEKPYEVNWKGKLGQSSDVTLTIALTNFPESMKNKASTLGYPEVIFLAKKMGNAAISHPENGFELKAELHSIFQNIRDKYSVERVHLLICASNAACIFVGQAFDLYQPELFVYDFDSNGMTPKLHITNKEGKVTLTLP